MCKNDFDIDEVKLLPSFKTACIDANIKFAKM